MIPHLYIESQGVDDMDHVLTSTPQFARHSEHLGDGSTSGADGTSVRVLRVPHSIWRGGKGEQQNKHSWSGG